MSSYKQLVAPSYIITTFTSRIALSVDWRPTRVIYLSIRSWREHDANNWQNMPIYMGGSTDYRWPCRRETIQGDNWLYVHMPINVKLFYNLEAVCVSHDEYQVACVLTSPERYRCKFKVMWKSLYTFAVCLMLIWINADTLWCNIFDFMFYDHFSAHSLLAKLARYGVAYSGLIRSDVPERVSISSPTCGTRHK